MTPGQIEGPDRALPAAPKSDVPSAGTQARRPRGRPQRPTRFTEMVPVRFTPELIDEIRARANADGCSVSSWIRRAAEHELNKPG